MSTRLRSWGNSSWLCALPRRPWKHETQATCHVCHVCHVCHASCETRYVWQPGLLYGMWLVPLRNKFEKQNWLLHFVAIYKTGINPLQAFGVAIVIKFKVVPQCTLCIMLSQAVLPCQCFHQWHLPLVSMHCCKRGWNTFPLSLNLDGCRVHENKLWNDGSDSTIPMPFVQCLHVSFNNQTIWECFGILQRYRSYSDYQMRYVRYCILTQNHTLHLLAPMLLSCLSVYSISVARSGKDLTSPIFNIPPKQQAKTIVVVVVFIFLMWFKRINL